MAKQHTHQAGITVPPPLQTAPPLSYGSDNPLSTRAKHFDKLFRHSFSLQLAPHLSLEEGKSETCFFASQGRGVNRGYQD